MISTAPSQISVINVTVALDRYNRTLTYWNSGILARSDVPANMSTDFVEYQVQYNRKVQYQNDITLTHQEGYDSFGDAFNYAVTNFRDVTENKLKGICARVRKRKRKTNRKNRK